MTDVVTTRYVQWDRYIVAGEEDISFTFETPGHYGIGDVTLTKRIGHTSKQYCVCDPSTDCQAACADI